jgi:serine/threonine-protein kinase HipA
MSRSYSIFLNDVLVGYLSEGQRGRASFRTTDGYRKMERRPVLSQSFEDDLERVYSSKRGALPAFFANLIPEPGPLRELIEWGADVPPSDELGLLEVVGGDLPGAVTVRREEYDPDATDENGNGNDGYQDPDGNGKSPDLRFSLAGVQLKFSMLRDAERLKLPAHGQGGEWIVKLDSSRFPQLVENEYATLQWARAIGFEVPDCQVLPIDALPGKLRARAQGGRYILVVRRYDREGGRRIHQEDFAQVVGALPGRKYDQVTYEQLARLIRAICGEPQYYEFIRRLAFVVASGNNDAHLKNWSLIYPDGIQPRLSPLYDQVFTLAWAELSPELSLKLAGVKELYNVDEAAFRRLAAKAGADEEHTLTAVRETLERSALAWRQSDAKALMPGPHLTALKEYWIRAPLLKGWMDNC